MDNELLRDIFTDSISESVKNTTRKDKEHPLKRIVLPGEYETAKQVSVNTETAFKVVFEENKEWLLSLKPRLLNINDYSESSSALAEIRAYSYLLIAGVLVKPISINKSSPTAEFSVDENNETVFIEVHAKQSNSLEAEELEKFYNKTPQFQKGQVWCVGEHIVSPFGKPETSEVTTENVISKIAPIKNKEHQFSAIDTSILWLDFQDETWQLLMTIAQLLPVSTWNGAFFSGGIWYAFYGWKDAPIFENFSLECPFMSPIIKMRHEGRFQKRTNLDAVVISFPRATVVLENPESQKPIKPWLWRKLISMPWFNFEYSYLNWPNPNLRQKLESQRNTLIALSNLAE